MAENKENIQEKLDSFFNKLNNLTKIQKIGIFAGTIVVIVGFYTWFFYLPRTEEIDRLEKKEQTLATQVATAKRKAARLDSVRKELEERKEEYTLVMNALPDTREIPGILSSLSESAKESGLELLKLTPGAETAKDFYAEIPVAMTIKGSFHQIALFFDKVSRFDRIVDIRSSNLDLSNENEIMASCNAVTYRFLKEKKNNKKKKK
ncbi:MAG: type 4a pilus biogenesis protein PilO [Thermodesulfobacteriota bacterium]